MVNKEAFAKRLQEVMDYYEISAAGLADKIGVQRSSISHLLSGRNNPSLDFILKLLEKYPQISFTWLVKGIGDLDAAEVDINENEPTPTLFDQQITTKMADSEEKKLQNAFDMKKDTAKTLEKILLLYSDGSFETFNPS